MPINFLFFPPLYCPVGIYRLLSDSHVRSPIYSLCRKGLATGLITASVYVLVTYPIQNRLLSIYLSLFYSTPSSHRFSTLMLVSTQFTAILQFFINKRIAQSRRLAYSLTIQSRAKENAFWGKYVEEFNLNTPAGRSLQNEALKQAKTRKSGWSGLVEGRKRSKALALLIKLLLLPVDVIPLVGIVIGATLRSVALTRRLLKPYFAAKNMSKYQREVFIQQRSFELRSFGFAAALLERTPFVGLLFSISTPIAAAMMAVDFEKRQNSLRCVHDADKPPWGSVHVGHAIPQKKTT
ncbi:hypothetical protein E3P89_03238 [Wallemia ichthyophaga]|uniref:Uncharacterized protein n=2 Tax=Wallemia ichthyophaga TaxID=245174 RepID=A0A4T0HV53_WALIC|nr:uncharacterized protein J056_001836 [Wallemia ichthyophaga EXF-994]TIA95507.1 hypothetical protein E3P96_03824 [Wallemia ichthyophaga]EOQ99513.1 hypothetical protein J056_001836 [Wallemia ichthyophaga EXF-994]TIB09447.1 hypothetical protein E3P93_03189 [Wallemia ichthyophaga]TIB09593.1 hypothetical protein E3P90_03220 [Wallemia ichthyophaga]TIB20368.1 hypothetical protein E3P89_03238 [Wallemia ichthyophaga]